MRSRWVDAYAQVNNPGCSEYPWIQKTRCQHIAKINKAKAVFFDSLHESWKDIESEGNYKLLEE
jgi:hypothetical protein